MATESPIRMLETSGKWPSHKVATAFAPSSANMTAEEMGLLLNGRMFLGNGKDMIPNRSGSAPPSMEGSLVAIENLISQRRSILNTSFAKLNSSINYDSKEQLHGDPAYLSYSRSDVNSNPRLTPSLISRENWCLVRHNGGFGNDWRLTSLDDSGNGSLRLSQGTLSTHKEESEDDRSPQRSSSDLADKSHGLWSGHDLAMLAGQHRSSVVSLREDLPHTPSPIYNQSLSLGHEISGEAIDFDSDYGSFNGLSVDTSNPVTSSSTEDVVGSSSSCVGPSTDQVSSSFVFKHTGNATSIPSVHNGESRNINLLLKDGVTVSDVAAIESKMKALNISTLPTSEDRKYQEELLHKNHNNLAQHQVHQQQNNTFQVQSSSVQSQMIFQGVNHSYIGMDHFLHGPTKFSAEVQPVFQSSGVTPPLYTTAAAYMNPANPFYPNLLPSSLFPHQYGLGEYALNTAAPPLIAGYPPHGAIPFAYDGVAAPIFTARMPGVSSVGSIVPGVSSVGSIVPGVDAQHLDQSYGHPGFALQPSFVDPLHMQYFQHPFWDAYAFSSHLDPLASGGGVIRSQMSAFDKQKGSDGAAYSHDQKLQNHRSGVLGNLNQRGETMGPNCFESPAMNIMMQYPSLPLANSVLPGSPVAGTSFPRGKNEMRFVPGLGRNSGVYSGWPGQRGVESFVDPKAYSFLEELKSGKGRRFDLSDIAGHIVEFSADQHGSRFIQQKLENCSVGEKASVFREVLPQASKLMTDVFGNYVIQKFFEYGSPDQRKELANQLTGQILPLSMQMYGCRVIQKALEVIDLDQKTRLVRELDGHVMRCVRDQNGNHVIQKCIESVPIEKNGFIISAFRGHVATLSTHPYGCRVIQRVLEHCTGNLHSQFIVDEILESVCALAQDQYGNYVTQHVLERGKPHERCQIIRKLSGQIVQLSQQKFASNVIEKCLEHGDTAERELLIREVVGLSEGNDNLLTMMKDQFANYVVQKVLETCSDTQREILLSRIKVHITALKKYTYGKHIVARFEQLFGELQESPM